MPIHLCPTAKVVTLHWVSPLLGTQRHRNRQRSVRRDQGLCGNRLYQLDSRRIRQQTSFLVKYTISIIYLKRRSLIMVRTVSWPVLILPIVLHGHSLGIDFNRNFSDLTFAKPISCFIVLFQLFFTDTCFLDISTLYLYIKLRRIR